MGEELREEAWPTAPPLETFQLPSQDSFFLEPQLCIDHSDFCCVISLSPSQCFLQVVSSFMSC